MKYLFFLLLFFNSFNGIAQTFLGNVALSGVNIIDVNHREPLMNQTVLIRGNRIDEIFPNGSHSIPDSFNILSLKGKFLLPGLMDSHVHMGTDPSGVDNRQQTLKVLEQMLFSGITTVRDMAGDARTLAGLSRDALVGDIISPDIYYSALMAGPSFFRDPRTIISTRGGQSGAMPYMLAVTDSTNLSLAVAEARGTGATGIKLYANLSAPLATKIIKESIQQGIIVWAHAWLQGAHPSDLVKAGVSSISHAPLVIYEKMDSIPLAWKNESHDEQFWEKHIPDMDTLFQLMIQHHTILDPTLITYKRMAEKNPGRNYSYQIGRQITAMAYKAGVNICTGTDDDQEEFVQKEIELLVRDAGMSPIDAIIASTRNIALLLRIDDKVGSVEPGKMADLLVLDKNPLEDISNIESVYLVMKNGRIFINKTSLP